VVGSTTPAVTRELLVTQGQLSKAAVLMASHLPPLTP
jgi:hypothetical protein